MNPYVQLYSARDIPLEESLAMIANTGYWGVEASLEQLDDVKGFMSLLSRHDLEVPSVHLELSEQRENFAACAEKVEALGCTHVVVPWFNEDERPTSVEGWKALGQELDGLQKSWKKHDCQLAWHNHDVEVLPLEDGSLPIDHLMETAARLRWEPDIAWIVRAGADPLPLIERYKKRLTAVQLKDIAPDGECVDEDGWADVGEGSIDWSSIMPALLGSRAMYYIVEHEKPADFQRFLKRSSASVGQFFGSA